MSSCSLNSQSRFVLNVFPMLVPFIVKSVEDLGWRVRQYGLVALASLLVSKVWLTINTGPFTGNLLDFPDQYLFMSHGPWVSATTYAIQGALFLALGGLIYAVCFARARHGGAAHQPTRRAA